MANIDAQLPTQWSNGYDCLENGTGIEIQVQNISENARVHNGHNFISYPRKRSSTSDTVRQNIFKWLSPLSFRQIHERIQQDASIPAQSDSLNGDLYSGKWLLESDVFDYWLSRRQRKLWYRGMPGAGKSVLASIIITRLLCLQREMKAEKAGRIAYLYLSYKERHPIEQLLGCVIKQLLMNEIRLPDPVLNLWANRNRGDEPPTTQDLSDLLQRLVEEWPVFVVIDALDECPQKDRLRLMNAIQPKSENFSILITSRHLDEFDDFAKDFQQKIISAQPSDLDLFINHEFNSRARLQKFSKVDVELQNVVKAAVKSACGGMFLLASLHMQSIAAELSPGAVRDRLTKLPREIDDMYKDALERIETLEQKKKNLALDTLSWVVFSYRPLTMEELQHCLAVIPNNLDFDFDRIYLEEDIRDCCGGLVTVVNGVVSLVHLTAQTYFNNIRESRFPGFQFVITQTCITYLSLNVLEQPDDIENAVSYADDLYHTPDPRSVMSIYRAFSSLNHGSQGRLTYQNKCLKFPFLEYAAMYLGRHLRQLSITDGPVNFIEPLLTLLCTRPKRNFLIRLMSEYHGLWRKLPQVKFQSNETSIEWQSDAISITTDAFEMDTDAISIPTHDFEMNVEIFLEHILESSDYDSEGDESDASGEIEASNDASPCLQDVSPVISPIISPLFEVASEHDPTPVPSDCDTSIREFDLENPLVHSTEPTNPPTACDPEITPMHLAAFLGFSPLVTRLMQIPEEALNINALDPMDRTPLAIAINESQWDTMSTLLKHGANINFVTSEGHAALLHIAESDESEAAKTFILDALNSDLSNIDCNELFEGVAVVMYCLCFVLTFLTAGFLWAHDKQPPSQQYWKDQLIKYCGESKTSQFQDKTQSKAHLKLLRAAIIGESKEIRRLVQDGHVNFENEDESVFRVISLFLAIEFSQAETVKELLDSGASVNVRGLALTTPLHRAAFRNSVEVVELLLEKKPVVDAKNNRGQTPWSMNADENHDQVLRLLRNAGANTNTREHDGVSRIYKAAAAGDLENVRWLLKNDVNPSLSTNYSWAPLHWAAHNGHLSCVEELLKYGADVNPMSDVSTTPLDMVRKSDQPFRNQIEGVLVRAGGKTAVQVLAEKRTAFGHDPGYDPGNDFSAYLDDDEEHYLKALDLITRTIDCAENAVGLSIKQRRRVFRAVSLQLRDLDDDDDIKYLPEEVRNEFYELRDHAQTKLDELKEQLEPNPEP